MNRTFLNFCRTIHIYLTMLGLAAMLLFGITGFTAYHEDWFAAAGPKHSTSREAITPTDLIEKKDSLRIVEHLRSTFRINGAMTEFDDEDDRYGIRFKEPGALWEVQVEKQDGRTTAKCDAYNFWAVINNLHRGRYSGRAWGWVIDLSALLIVLACFTGVILWMVLPRRRKIGTAALLLGTLITFAVYWWLVPGPDLKVDLNAPRPVAEQ